MLICLCFLGVAVYGVVVAFAGWRQRHWKAVLPLVTCLLAVAVFRPVAILTRQAVFAWALPSYEAVVRQVESGGIPATAKFASLPQAERQARLTYGVFGSKEPSGKISIMFFTDEGFPALHSGYFYDSSGEPGPGMELRWPIVERVRGNWFYFSN